MTSRIAATRRQGSALLRFGLGLGFGIFIDEVLYTNTLSANVPLFPNFQFVHFLFISAPRVASAPWEAACRSGADTWQRCHSDRRNRWSALSAPARAALCVRD